MSVKGSLNKFVWVSGQKSIVMIKEKKITKDKSRKSLLKDLKKLFLFKNKLNNITKNIGNRDTIKVNLILKPKENNKVK